MPSIPKSRLLKLAPVAILLALVGALGLAEVRLAEKAQRRAVSEKIALLTRPGYPNAGARETQPVSIEPTRTRLRPTPSPGYDGKMRRILVLPIQITNRSAQTMRATCAHEWFGGMWPPTDLYVYNPKNRDLSPVFLEGETGKEEHLIWRAGQTQTLRLRLDWPGTGSVRGGTIVPADQAGQYSLRVVMFFESAGRKQWIVSPRIRVSVAP